MEDRQSKWPYIVGLAIGFLMVNAFVFGYRILLNTSAFWGGVLVTFALSIWPLYVLGVIVLLFVQRKKPFGLDAKTMKISLFFPFIGAVLGVLLFPVLYILFG